MMFYSVSTDLIAQGEKKVILPVMACAEQRPGFGDQFLVRRKFLRRHREVRLIIGDQVHDMNRRLPRLAELNLAIARSRYQWRIDQRGQRYGSKFDFVAAAVRHGQGN